MSPRFVIFGAGAIGGAIGARLHQADHEVLLVTRGAHYEAIATSGLRLRTPVEDVRLTIPIARNIAAARLRDDDIVFLCVKSQDTTGALQSLRDTGKEPAVVCMQNSVENERAALRLFPRVYGAVVLMPVEHLEPGTVIAFAARQTGHIDVGRYPQGIDSRAEMVAAALAGARFEAKPCADIRTHKYAKLINNVGNAVEALLGPEDPDVTRMMKLASDEARTVLRTAGIDFDVAEIADVGAAWRRMDVGEVDGHAPKGRSTWQSIARGAQSVETDFLNGEIVLIARQHNLRAPINEALQRLIAQTLRERLEPGWLSLDHLLGSVDDSGHAGLAPKDRFA